MALALLHFTTLNKVGLLITFSFLELYILVCYFPPFLTVTAQLLCVRKASTLIMLLFFVYHFIYVLAIAREDTSSKHVHALKRDNYLKFDFQESCAFLSVILPATCCYFWGIVLLLLL